MASTHSNGTITAQDALPQPNTTGGTTKPTVLCINSSVREVDVARWGEMQTRFNVLEYDCATVDEFTARLKTPGHAYTRIDALLWTGWLKAGPFAAQTEQLLRGEPLELMPPSLRLVCCSGHGYDHADVARMMERGIVYCNTPDACTERRPTWA
ncbi:D-isomer specific 2-hydroxyacid dehydrogenase, catalytic domain-containing protein [Cladophialophora immunda]|nr:D-isomer specific 2-hydroxyacid dehydrogenase, catalytic domain-containing protein [Cladophialophora immunda]